MANLPAVATSDVYSELGLLSSTGITRRHRYYEPLRHPLRPGLSLAGVRLEVTRLHRWGFPCCIGSPCTVMPSSLPRRNCWTKSFVRSSNGGLPRYTARSASALSFSRPAQRSLTLRPDCSLSRQKRPVHQRLRQICYLLRRSDCYRLERPVAGRELHR